MNSLQHSIGRRGSLARRFLAALLVLFSLMAPLAQSSGQLAASPDARERAVLKAAKRAQWVPTTIMLMGKLPRDAKAVIMRRALTKPHDVIVLRTDAATPALLASAVSTMATARKLWGDTAKHDQLIEVFPETTTGRRRLLVEGASEKTLKRLRGKPATMVAGVGSGKSTEVFLPSKRVLLARGEHAEIVRSRTP